MKVISGEFKGTKLNSVNSFRVRPTANSTKERIFGILFSCHNKTILDLFAGSGGLGIEAISRGADSVTFVDNSFKSIQAIKKNLEKLGIFHKSTVRRQKTSSFLNSSTEKFDYIFIDPPYNKNLVDETLILIFKNMLLEEKGIIIVEHSVNEQIAFKKFEIFKQKNLGESKISFLMQKKKIKVEHDNFDTQKL